MLIIVYKTNTGRSYCNILAVTNNREELL